jgi:diguanylate cyclase (GGDEF)-like protein
MTQRAPAPKPDLPIDELVRGDKLRLLFRQSPFAVMGAFLSSLILGWLLWDMGDHHRIAGWLGLLGLSTLMRLTLIVIHYRAKTVHLSLQRWELVYWSTMAISAGIWGLGALFVMPQANFLAEVIVLIFTVGLAGSAVLAYAPYGRMTSSAIALVLAPVTLWFLLQPAPLLRGLALATLLFAGSALRTSTVLSGALTKALRLSHEMELAHRLSSHAAQTDALTGISSRRAFHERGEQLFSYCLRNQRPLSAIVMDIDHFKQINDSHGHHIGDAVLLRVGELLQISFRKTDACGRLGGEEFAMLLADVTAEEAVDVAEKLRRAVSELDLKSPNGDSIPITASLGVADAGDDLQTLIQRADKAMYQAKVGGRNRVVAAAAGGISAAMPIAKQNPAPSA